MPVYEIRLTAGRELRFHHEAPCLKDFMQKLLKEKHVIGYLTQLGEQEKAHAAIALHAVALVPVVGWPLKKLLAAGFRRIYHILTIWCAANHAAAINPKAFS